MCFWRESHGEGNGRWPHCLFLAPKPWSRQRLLAFTVCFWHSHDEGNGRLLSPRVFGPKPWRRQRLLAFTMWFCRQNPVCFWHQYHLPSPCVFGTKAMVKATAACLHHVLSGTKTMAIHNEHSGHVLHRLFWHQSHGEDNGSWPSPCVFGTRQLPLAFSVLLAPKPWRRQRPLAFIVCFWRQHHGEGNGRLPSSCVFGPKTTLKATAATKTVVKERPLAFTACFGRLPQPCALGTKAMVRA